MADESEYQVLIQFKCSFHFIFASVLHKFICADSSDLKNLFHRRII